MSETPIGKLWIRTDEDGTQRLGGVVLHDVPAGTHVRLRKNRGAHSRRDGEYLLLVVEKPTASNKSNRNRSSAELPATDPSIHSFDVSDAEWEAHERSMGR